MTNAKCVYYNQIFDRYKYDMKKTWNIISETLNRKVKNPIPETMTIVDACGWTGLFEDGSSEKAVLFY